MGLNAAAFHGHWRLCQFLLESGADVNFREKDTGETPLHSALSSHRAARHWVVKVLLDAGADPNVATKPSAESGRSCAMCEHGEKHLCIAPLRSQTRIRFSFCSTRAKTDAKDMNGASPLTWASRHLRPDSILRKLLYHGFSIHPALRTMDACLLGTPLASQSSQTL